MAYVGTARNLGNDQNTMRSVVLGEASGQGLQGETAVAAVIYNRAAINSEYPGSFPGGSTAVGVATAPNQFQGQVDLSRYSSAQIGQADQAIANAQGGMDPTGGATFYANPGASSASWARNLNNDNSVQIGSHYFTDNTNGLVFKGNDPNGGGDMATVQSAAATDGGWKFSDPYSTDHGVTVRDAGRGDDPAATPSPDTASPTVPQTAQAPSTSSTGSNPQKANPADVAPAIATGADETSAATIKAGADASAASKSLLQGLYSAAFAGVGDLVSRIGLIVVGLVLLAGALYIIAAEHGAPVPAGGAIRKVGKTVFA